MTASRLPCLDGLRGLAAVLIVLFHFNFAFVPSANLYAIVPLQRAYISVDMFFLLSGFVMAFVYGERMMQDRAAAWRPFLVARFARLYPLFVLTLAVLAALVGSGLMPHSKFVTFGFSTLLLQPVMLQALHYGLNWNYPSWSIGTEIAAYVLFIFAGRYLLRGKYAFLVGMACLGALAALCWARGGTIGGSQIPAYLRTFCGFSLGVLMYRSYRDAPQYFRTLGLLVILPAGVLAWISGYDVFTVISLGGLIAVCVTDEGILRYALDSAPLRALGDWSYGIYLWHAPVHFAITAALVSVGLKVEGLSTGHARELAFITLALVIGIASLAYKYFEIPMRRHIASRTRRLTTPALA